MILLPIAMLLLGDVTVTLPPTAEARGTELTVGAVARVEGADPEEVARVRELSIGYAPAPGYTRLFDGWRLQQQIQRDVPSVTVQVVGSRACRVSPATMVVSGASIEAAARAELERVLASMDAQAELQTPVADMRAPASAEGRSQPELRSVLTPEQLRAGNVSVPVRVMIDGDVYRTLWTSWRVQLWENYAVLKSPAQAGMRISPDMLEVRRLEASASNVRPGAQALGRHLLVGAVAARDLAPGRPLTDTDIVRPTLVREGDTTFLEVRKGAINARVAAVAEQDGAQGDRIEVTLLSSGRLMKAVVISRDLVRIDLTSPK